jgi:hypothetical protein
LFNTQKLLRKKAINGASSREDMISLNGRVLPKEEVSPEKKMETPKEEVKTGSSKDKQTPKVADKKETPKADIKVVGKEKPKEVHLLVDSKKKNPIDKK